MKPQGFLVAQQYRIYLQCRRHRRPVQSLGQEGSLQEGMVTHSGILARKIPCTEEPGGLQSIGCKELDMTAGTEHNETFEKKVR